TLIAFILALFLKGNSYEFHFTLILFCKQGRTAEVTICRHKGYLFTSNVQIIYIHQLWENRKYGTRYVFSLTLEIIPAICERRNGFLLSVYSCVFNLPQNSLESGYIEEKKRT